MKPICAYETFYTSGPVQDFFYTVLINKGPGLKELCAFLPRFWVFSERSETTGVHLSSHIDVHWRVSLGQVGWCRDASCTHWGGWRLCQTRPGRHSHAAVMLLKHRHIQEQGMSGKSVYNVSMDLCRVEGGFVRMRE